MHESRTHKGLLNARVNLIFYFITLVLAFFSRKIFLDCLGADFIGLTGTIGNLLGFLNLAELGIGTAIGYVLYKPIYEHDETKISEIISVFGYLYRCIGLIILGVGIALSFFLPLIFPHTEFQSGIIYFAYFSFLSSSLIGYFANYRQTLLGADQRNYVVTAYFQTAYIIKTIIQMACAYYTGNYYLWIAIELSFGVIYSFILNWKINSVYPWLRSEVKLGKKIFKKYPDVMRYTKQLFVHKIAGFVQFQTTPFLIYAFVSLQTVAYYGNYTLIIEKLNFLINNLLSSTGAGIGNLIAEGNKEKIIRVFWELIAIRFFIAGVFIFCLYHLAAPFISLWLGEQYIMANSVLIMILCNSFIAMTRTTDQFLYGYGLFYDTWAPITESIIYISVAMVGGHLWNLQGILLGGIIASLVIVCGWKPYFLFKKGFQIPVKSYWINWTKYLGIITISFIISSGIIKEFILITPSNSYMNWIKYAFAITSLQIVINFSLLYIGAQGMRDFVRRIIHKMNH